MNKKDIFPKIKKEIKYFLYDESGSMSKENILKAGITLGATYLLVKDVSAHHTSSTTHTNTLTLQSMQSSVTGTHSHHSNQIDGC